MRPAKPKQVALGEGHCCLCHSGTCGHIGLLLCPQHMTVHTDSHRRPLPPWWQHDDAEPRRAPEISWDKLRA